MAPSPLSLLPIFPLLVRSFVPVPWQTQRYYGYDGPWQALTLNVGGFMNGTTASSQWTSVDMLPGGSWDTFVISTSYCSSITAASNTATTDTPTTADVTCPASNSTTYTASNGDLFEIQCGIDHSAGNLASLSTTTFGACIEACADTAGCVNLAYSGTACYLKGSIGTTVYDGSWGATIVKSTSTLTGVCQVGNTWNPGLNQTQSGQSIAWEPSLNYVAMNGPYMTGMMYAQNLVVPSTTNGPPYIIQNSSTVSVTVGNITLPSGGSTSLDIGFLALGAPSQQQDFSLSSSDANLPEIVTWNLPGALYNQSQIKSYTYGLQIGSAAYNYPGSLVFGGYDQGRAIGPPTTFANTPPELQDIVIGVESGASPFSFQSKTGLLLDTNSQPTSVPANINPITPYLHLTRQTCDNLATILPITYDPVSGYYLWNQNDTLYEAIVTSPSYLGFVFPPAAGDTEQVTIKVPFALLNLSLTSPAISSGSRPYFPCMPYTTTNGEYTLGRAFLQAAFVGRNWNQQISWLAQAPGPGSSNQGLGTNVVDIEDGATTLSFYNDTTLFNMSWSGILKPLKASPATTNTSAPAPSGSSSTAAPKSSKLSTGALVGAIVGGVVGGVLLLALLIGALICVRKRTRSSSSSAAAAAPSATATSDSPTLTHPHASDAHPGSPLYFAKLEPTPELAGMEIRPELSNHHEPAELEGARMQADAYGGVGDGEMHLQ